MLTGRDIARRGLTGVLDWGRGVFVAPATPDGALPACTAERRGAVARTEGGAGAADAHVVCRKDAANAYAWLDLLSPPASGDVVQIVPRTAATGEVLDNASSTALETVATATAVLPAGTWEVTTIAVATFRNNTAGSGAALIVTAPGTPGAEVANNAGIADDRFTLMAHLVNTVVSDGTTATAFRSRYRANSGGTARSLANLLLAICRKVG